MLYTDLWITHYQEIIVIGYWSFALKKWKYFFICNWHQDSCLSCCYFTVERILWETCKDWIILCFNNDDNIWYFINIFMEWCRVERIWAKYHRSWTYLLFHEGFNRLCDKPFTLRLVMKNTIMEKEQGRRYIILLFLKINILFFEFFKLKFHSLVFFKYFFVFLSFLLNLFVFFFKNIFVFLSFCLNFFVFFFKHSFFFLFLWLNFFVFFLKYIFILLSFWLNIFVFFLEVLI